MVRRGAGWWDYAACILLAIVPIVTHMLDQGFRLASIDAIGLVFPFLLLGTGFGALVQRSPKRGRIAELSLLTLIFLDLQFDLHAHMPVWVIIIGTVAACALLWEHYTRIVTLSVATILVGVIVRPSKLAIRSWRAPNRPVPAGAASLVPVVHIIFDEHGSPRSFPADIPEAVRAKERVLAFYRQHGFRLYEKAYSRYAWTHSSIPATLSPLGPEELAAKMTGPDDQHFTVTDNRLFRWAAGQGYRIHVVETTYLDVCERAHDLIASCRAIPISSLESIRLLPLDVVHRILLEDAFFFVVESAVVGNLWRRRPAPRSLIHRGVAGMALHELDRLTAQIRTALSGSYYYGHFLVPHFPYEVNSACKARPVGERLAAGWLEHDVLGNTPTSRRTRWALQAGQTECLYIHLDSLIAAIDSASPPQGVRIVIQGDHGSRITTTPPTPQHAGELTSQDLLDGFAALVAVRGPGIPAGLDSAVVAVQDVVPWLITGAANGEIDRPPTDSAPAVYLERYGKPGGKMVRLPAPSLAH